MALYMFVGAQEGIGVVDQPVGTQKHIFRPADREVKKVILFAQYAPSCHHHRYLPSLKYLFKVSLKLLELFTNTFLWLSRICRGEDRDTRRLTSKLG